MKILVKYPSRSRPEKFKQVLQRYIDTCKTDSIRYLFSFDSDDKELPKYVDAVNSFQNRFYRCGGMQYCSDRSSTGKINAINRDFDLLQPWWAENPVNWDILVLASDDMIPVIEGWDERIIEDMKENYPDGDGVLYYYDGHQPLNTMPIMGRKYYERFNYIYHPDYISLWCDNEFETVADMLGKQTKYPDILFEHQCWFNGMGKRWQETNDPLMKKNQSYFGVDRDTFNKRKALNFGL